MTIREILWVFVLKSKDEAYVRFKDWLTLYENRLVKKLKHLRTDNGWNASLKHLIISADRKESLDIERFLVLHNKMA